MKRFTFLMCAILACLIKVNAQEPQFVSTEQQNRNVFIEELTGRLCGYCPGGQATVNQIIKQYPGQVFTVNIHRQSSLSPTNYPNLNTGVGAEIYDVFNAGGIPCAVVNRSTAKATYSNEWATAVAQQIQQTSEVNVAGQVVVNSATRTATITVEAYYTANSASDNNYLTVMMLQDSILGDQAGASGNPSQIVNGKYCHMHILRDIVTPTWGEAIAPTTAGTLVTKSYVYKIPEVIGEPNGVEVDLNNIHFMALVTEKQQGSATRPILNVCELTKVEGVEEPIYPFIKTIEQEDLITCTHEKKFSLNVVNAGTEVITSLKIKVTDGNGEVSEEGWNGNIPVYGNVSIDMFAEVPFGEHNVVFEIVEANGTEYSFEKAVYAKCEKWLDIEIGETAIEEEIKLELAQDRWGNQTTWKVLGSDDRVIAEGGPYPLLKANGIEVHEETIKIPVGECAMFVIEDCVGNGINSGCGEGYYKLYDSKGNTLVESDGNYGFGEYHVIYVHGAMSVENVMERTFDVYPNPVKETLTVSGENMSQINVVNALGQVVKSVRCNDDNVQINMNDLQNGMYFVNIIDNNGKVSTSKVSVLR